MLNIESSLLYRQNILRLIGCGDTGWKIDGMVKEDGEKTASGPVHTRNKLKKKRNKLKNVLLFVFKQLEGRKIWLPLNYDNDQKTKP